MLITDIVAIAIIIMIVLQILIDIKNNRPQPRITVI